MKPIRHKIDGNLVTFYNDAPQREDVKAGFQGFEERELKVEFQTNPPLSEDIEKVMFAIQHRSINWTLDHSFIPAPLEDKNNPNAQCKICAHRKEYPFHI